MTHNTSIPKRQLGPPRFESDPEQTRPGEVKTYTLSPEELEKYKNLPKPEGKKPIDLRFRFNPKKKEELKMANIKAEIKNEELTKEKYFELKEQGKTDSAIRVMYNLYPVKLTNMKREWGLLNQKSSTEDLILVDEKMDYGDEKESKQLPRPASVVAKLDQLEDLQKQLDEKDKTITSYSLVIDSLKKDLNKKSEMINLLKSLLREVL